MTSASNPNPGKIAENPKSAGSTSSELDDEHVARLRAFDVDRAREQVLREVDLQQVRVDAVAADLVSGPERRVERHDLAGPHDEGRLDVRVPAVVPLHALSSTSLRGTFDRSRAGR